jgi:hypothetical protein
VVARPRNQLYSQQRIRRDPPLPAGRSRLAQRQDRHEIAPDLAGRLRLRANRMLEVRDCSRSRSE